MKWEQKLEVNFWQKWKFQQIHQASAIQEKNALLYV